MIAAAALPDRPRTNLYSASTVASTASIFLRFKTGQRRMASPGKSHQARERRGRLC